MKPKERKRFKFVDDTPTVKLGQTPVSRAGFYTDPRWRKLRNAYIAENPLCEHCKSKQRYIPAQVVDHIEPLTLENMWILGLDWENLQGLCYKCHRIKTNKSKGKYSPDNIRKGRALQNKFNNFNK